MNTKYCEESYIIYGNGTGPRNILRKERFCAKELLVQCIVGYDTLVSLIYTSIIQRGNDLLKEQLYEEYDMT